MAHQIYEIDGEYSMAYFGEKPWHGLGQEVPEGADIETWIKKSHTDFEIIRTPAVYFTPKGEMKMVPNLDALIRSDNHEHLSHVSPRYNVTQPAELVRFFESLIKLGGFQMSSAGSIFNGKRVWATATVNKEMKLAGGKDILQMFLLLAGSCDKSLANVARFTNTRVVCNNTLSAAIPNRPDGGDIRIPHTQKFDPEKIKAELGLVDETFEKSLSDITLLTKTKMPRKEALKFFLELFIGEEQEESKPEGVINFPGSEDVSSFLTDITADDHPDKVKAKMKEANKDDLINFNKIPVRSVMQMVDLLDNGKGQKLKTANGTAWGALNAVTEYYDHHQANRSLDHRINSTNFGKGQRIKDRAFNLLLKKAA